MWAKKGRQQACPKFSTVKLLVFQQRCFYQANTPHNAA